MKDIVAGHFVCRRVVVVDIVMTSSHDDGVNHIVVLIQYIVVSFKMQNIHFSLIG